MSLSSLLKSIGSWFTHIFAGAETLFESLTVDEQAAVKISSQVFAMVSKYEGEAEPFIKLVFPNVPIDTIHGFLQKWLEINNQAAPLTFPEVCQAVANYLKQFEGNKWITEVQGGVNLFASLLSPNTPIQKFINVAEYVYQLFVKPKVTQPDGVIKTQGNQCSQGYHWDSSLGKCVADVG